VNFVDIIVFAIVYIAVY